ncbi:MAG TPA: hypothetical protein VJM32_00345 [Candidatus Saccharimonadales bacterium]|nr:hypothetical protein [Candidatus Saccharimonadales bacterium]
MTVPHVLDTDAPQRARTAFVIGVGREMAPEWDTSRVPQALRRLTAAAQPYAPHSRELSVVYFGTSVLLSQPTTLGEFEQIGLFNHPNCGPGSNLSAGIYAALSQREGDERLHIYVVSDCNIDPEELERATYAIEHARNVIVILIRVSTDAEGLDSAYELDTFATGPADKVELVHYNDAKGRDVGANLETHVSNRMSAILARRHMPAAV